MNDGDPGAVSESTNDARTTAPIGMAVQHRLALDPDTPLQTLVFMAGTAIPFLQDELRALRLERDQLTTALQAAIVKAVADTFREIQSWGVELPGESGTEMAAMVEGDLSWCCPVCQEVECDSDCPLAPARAVLGGLTLNQPAGDAE